MLDYIKRRWWFLLSVAILFALNIWIWKDSPLTFVVLTITLIYVIKSARDKH